MWSLVLVSTAAASLWSGLSPVALPSLSVGTASCEEACYTGACTYCNDVCFNNKEGRCAQCWVVNQTLGLACLSSDPALPDCRTCWSYSPCQLCRTGSCARCEACQQSREGDCASCWEPDSAGYTCVLGYQGNDCRGCWQVNNRSMPIIVASGFSASTLVATWKKVPLCKDSVTPTVIWPWPDNVTVLELLCYTKLLKLTFDPTTNTFHNLPGVNVSVVDFGGFSGVAFGPFMGVFETFGYREGVNMFGAPFDWRLPSQGSQRLYTDLKALVERVYASSGQKVVLLAPSYGPQVILGFLQLMSQQWKDTYVSWFLAMSPVWSGSSTAIYAMASGLAPFANASELLDRGFREMEVHLPSLMWLSPQPGNDNYTFPKDLPLILTPSQNYSAADLSKILVNVGFEEAVAQATYLQQSGSLYHFEPPLVNTWINYGYDIDTALSFTFNTSLSPSKMPQLSNYTLVSGDGIVTERSSLRGMLWAEPHQKAQKQLIHSGFSEMVHAACVLPVLDPNHTACFYELMAFLVNGTLPKPALVK